MKANPVISLIKFARTLLVLGLVFQMPTEKMVGTLLPEEWAKLTIGAAVIALINFLKHQFGDKIPVLKKVF